MNFRFKHFPPWLPRPRCRGTAGAPFCHLPPKSFELATARHDPALPGQAGVIDWKKDDVSSKGTKCWNEVSSGSVHYKTPADERQWVRPCPVEVIWSFGCPRSDTWPQQSVIAVGPSGKMWLDQANCVDAMHRKTLIYACSHSKLRALSNFLTDQTIQHPKNLRVIECRWKKRQKILFQENYENGAFVTAQLFLLQIGFLSWLSWCSCQYSSRRHLSPLGLRHYIL